MRRFCLMLICVFLLFSTGACKKERVAEVENGMVCLTVGALHMKTAVAVDYLNYLQNTAKSYCMAREGMEIELVDYGEVQDAEALSRLSSELASGKGPDILLLDGMPYARYAAQGLLCDLNPYLDSADSALKRDELFAGPLRAMEYGGGLYCISPQFNVRVNVGLRSLLGEGEITFERLVELWAQRPEGMVTLRADSNNSALALLDTCLTGAEALGFVDKGAKTCAFEREDFVNILKLCATLPRDSAGESELSGETFSPYLLLREQEALFYPALISYPEQYVELLTGLGEDVRFFGEPGLGDAGAVCECKLPLAITSASQNKNAAWEFLTYVVRSSGVKPGGVPMALPLVRENLDAYLADTLGLPALWTLYEQGDETALEQMRLDVWNGTYTAQIRSVPFTREVYQALLQLVDSASVERVGFATATYGLFQEVENIAREEAQLYFAGEASAEEAAARIQSRTGTFLAEQA